MPPSGGERDRIPPKPEQTIPANFSTDFTSSSILFVFKEFVTLQNPNRNIYISPPLEKPLVVKLKQKKLFIRLNNELKPNTTYIISFNKAVADITEGNVLDDYKYVFSTGESIDSLNIAGKVIQASDNKPVKNTAVMLYKELNDSVVMKNKPFYFTKTDEQGYYKIDYIGHGEYKLFALKDVNNNLLFDLPTESIAFKENVITINDSNAIQDLFLFIEDKKKTVLIRSFSPSLGKVVFIFNKPVDKISINIIGIAAKKPFELIEETKTRDTVIFWTSNTYAEELDFLITKGDTTIDTAKVKMKTSTESRLTIKLKSKRDSLLSPGSDLQLIFDHPAKLGLLDNIQLAEDTMQKPVKPVVEYIDDIRRQLSVKYNWRESVEYRLTIPDSTFQDIFGLYNREFSFKFKVDKHENYGSLKLTINWKSPDVDYIIQLINNGSIISKAILNDTLSLKYPFLKPGKYTVRVIEDLNNNWEWDTGNYLKKRQPERVFQYAEQIIIRANWDMDIELNQNDTTF